MYSRSGTNDKRIFQNKLLILINNHLNHNFTSEERILFEEHLASNPLKLSDILEPHSYDDISEDEDTKLGLKEDENDIRNYFGIDSQNELTEELIKKARSSHPDRIGSQEDQEKLEGEYDFALEFISSQKATLFWEAEFVCNSTSRFDMFLNLIAVGIEVDNFELDNCLKRLNIVLELIKNTPNTHSYASIFLHPDSEIRFFTSLVDYIPQRLVQLGLIEEAVTSKSILNDISQFLFLDTNFNGKEIQAKFDWGDAWSTLTCMNIIQAENAYRYGVISDERFTKYKNKFKSEKEDKDNEFDDFSSSIITVFEYENLPDSYEKTPGKNPVVEKKTVAKKKTMTKIVSNQFEDPLPNSKLFDDLNEDQQKRYLDIFKNLNINDKNDIKKYLVVRVQECIKRFLTDYNNVDIKKIKAEIDYYFNKSIETQFVQPEKMLSVVNMMDFFEKNKEEYERRKELLIDLYSFWEFSQREITPEVNEYFKKEMHEEFSSFGHDYFWSFLNICVWAIEEFENLESFVQRIFIFGCENEDDWVDDWKGYGAGEYPQSTHFAQELRIHELPDVNDYSDLDPKHRGKIKTTEMRQKYEKYLSAQEYELNYLWKVKDEFKEILWDVGLQFPWKFNEISKTLVKLELKNKSREYLEKYLSLPRWIIYQKGSKLKITESIIKRFSKLQDSIH